MAVKRISYPYMGLLLWIMAYGIAHVDGSQTFYVREDEGPRLVGTIKNTIDSTSQLTTEQLSQVRYTFFAKDDPVVAFFTLDEKSGQLSTKSSINHEGPLCKNVDPCVLSIEAVAYISATGYFNSLNINIVIQDINDNPPVFPVANLDINIIESAKVDDSFPLVAAKDADGIGNNSRIKYEFAIKPKEFRLNLKKNLLTGDEELALIVERKLDREIVSEYFLRIVATDFGVPSLSSTLDVSVKVMDINDHAPTFSQKVYNETIKENSPINMTVVTVIATDKDAGLNRALRYSFLSSDGVFDIDNYGVIRVNGVVDYEQTRTHRLVVSVTDQGQQPRTAQALVIVNVQDENDNAPSVKFSFLSSDSATISETSKVGDFIAQASVSDPDSGDNGRVQCSITDRRFRLTLVKENRYKITLNSTIDREETPAINLSLRCHDLGSSPKSSINILHIVVQDVNDKNPRFKQSTYFPIMMENNNIGDDVITVLATDDDSGINAELTYYLESGVAGKFRIGAKTGKITAMIRLDRELVPQWRFLVWVRDHGTPSRSASASVVLTLLDENDKTPSFLPIPPYFGVTENLPAGIFVGKVTANDTDLRESGDVTYFLADDNDSKNFRISHYDGTITSRVTFDRELKDSYKITVIARDGGTPRLTSSVSIRVNILDVNDNKPVSLFPSPFNNSLTFSLMSGDTKSRSLTKIIAYDDDYQENSTLTYTITYSNCSKCFSINHNSGNIVLLGKKHGYPSPYTINYIVVDITDGGPIPRSIEVKLYITLQVKNISGTEKTEANNDNVFIVAGVITATLLLSIIIVIVILLIRRKDKYAQAERHALNTSAIISHQQTDIETGSPKVSDYHCDRILIKEINSSSRSSIRSNPQKGVSVVIPPPVNTQFTNHQHSNTPFNNRQLSNAELNTSNTSFRSPWLEDVGWEPLPRDSPRRPSLTTTKPPHYNTLGHRENDRSRPMTPHKSMTSQKSVRWHGDTENPTWRHAPDLSTFTQLRVHTPHLDDTHSDHSGDSGRGGSEEDNGSKVLPHYV